MRKAKRMEDREPRQCGQSIGFDGLYVCTLYGVLCKRVKDCPCGKAEVTRV